MTFFGARGSHFSPDLEVGPGTPGCAHCGLPSPAGCRFCCPGCAAAFETIQALGLGRYYAQRLLDPAQRAPKPEASERWDLFRHIIDTEGGHHRLILAVDGLQCGACVWLIESVLSLEPGVVRARINMTSRRLTLEWNGPADDAARLVGAVEQLGYRLVPFTEAALSAAGDRTGRRLLRALAVAGFAAGNVMLMSIGIWAGGGASDGGPSMGPATRELLHWVSALVAMPAIAYAGMPFFGSAFSALRRGRTNMDVPISVGVILVTAMSLEQTIAGGPHTYFDSATSLLFFLLIGRLLDHRARGQARATAEQLLILRTTDVAVLRDDGTIERRAQEHVAVGELVLAGMGERVGVDGVVERGSSSLDASLVTGESLPVPAEPGTHVFAGTLNIGAPIVLRVTATGETTLLAECVRLIEAAETRRGRFVVLADRVARAYAPAVHLAALLTFLGWYFVAGASAGGALLIACAVLIVTCPCALALAVPAVQVIATSRLLRTGILLKSPTALERLADIDMVVFDKTGTLTKPSLALAGAPPADDEARRIAASMAVCSRHPLARALVASLPVQPAAAGTVEVPGKGLSLTTPQGEIRLGSARFCGLPAADCAAGPELFLTSPACPFVRFTFAEHLRDDAAETVAALRAMGLQTEIISGDRAGSVARAGQAAGIAAWRAGRSPLEKIARIEALARDGHRILMVGDGLNDGPCLAAAFVSASPATGADISQTVADFVFQGQFLAPVAAAIAAARRARRAMRQNLMFAIGYNVVLVPLAVAGFVTPWLAAASMSASSLMVMANSFRQPAPRQLVRG